MNLYKFFNRRKDLKTIGCFDRAPTKYSNDRSFEPLQTIRLGKYEKHCAPRFRFRILKIGLDCLFLWIIWKCLYALFFF